MLDVYSAFRVKFVSYKLAVLFIALFGLFSLVSARVVFAACGCGGSSSCTVGGSCSACVPNSSCSQGHACCTGTGSATSGGGCHCNTGGNGSEDPVAPGKPVLKSPADGSLVPAPQVLLVWDHNDKWGRPITTRYFEVRIWEKDNDSTLREIRIYDRYARSYTVSISPGITYEWQIEAHNGAKRKRSDVWEFMVGYPPQAQLSSILWMWEVQSIQSSYKGTTYLWGEATDQDNNLQRVDFYRRCVSGLCYNNSSYRSWSRIFTSGDFSARNYYANSYAHSWQGMINAVGEWELVVNAYDTQGMKCSGNPDPTYPANGWTDCNTSGLDLVDVTVFNEKPRGTISFSGYSQSTRFRTVNRLDPVTLALYGYDREADLRSVEVHRRCISGDCYAVAANRSWRAVDVNFVAASSVYTGGYSWTSLPASDVGRWQYMVAVSDRYDGWCAGDTAWSPGGGIVVNDCDWFNQYDLVTVEVEPAYTISGIIFDTDGSCGEDPATRNIVGSIGHVSIANGDYAANASLDASAAYVLGGFPTGYSFDGACLSGSVPSGDPDWRYDLACAQDNHSVTFNASDDCLWGTSRVNLTAPLDLDFGYRPVSTLTVGWFTSINGGVFSGADVYRTVPTNPIGFTGELFDGSGIERFALAGNSVDVATGDDTSRVGGHGYLDNMGGGVSILPPGFNVAPPPDAESISSLSNLDPDQVYVMDASTFDSLISGGTLQCSSFISSDGVVVLYLENDGATITFDRDFCSTSSNRRLLILTDSSILVSRVFGTILPNPGSASNIGAYILTTGDVVFEGTTDPLDDPDISMVVDGGLVATGEIRFERDLGLNNVYPAEVVRYDYRFLYDLTKQAHEDPEFSRIGLFQTNVDWDIYD